MPAWRWPPAPCVCPGRPWFCIHYPWVQAAGTMEFKRGSLPLTSTCILHQPLPYQPRLRFRRCQSRTQEPRCQQGARRGRRHLVQNPHIHRHNHVGGCDLDWQVSESLTGTMEPTITHQGGESGLIPPDTPLAHRHFNHMLTRRGHELLHACHIVSVVDASCDIVRLLRSRR